VPLQLGQVLWRVTVPVLSGFRSIEVLLWLVLGLSRLATRTGRRDGVSGIVFRLSVLAGVRLGDLGGGVVTAQVFIFPHSAPRMAPLSPEQLSGQVVKLEPYRVLRDFGVQWQAYLRAHFASITDAALAFGVTERAARRWWDGSGPRGAFVAIALRMHPETAPGYLLGDAPVQAVAA